jgi:hypothetical protein
MMSLTGKLVGEARQSNARAEIDAVGGLVEELVADGAARQLPGDQRSPSSHGGERGVGQPRVRHQGRRIDGHVGARRDQLAALGVGQ